MAGLEVVVRPVVFPNSRPAPARSLPPSDDPDKGFAVIRGNGAKQIDLTNSYSANASTSTKTETKRRVDQARVYQKNDDGSVNKENFVDIEVANKIWMQGLAEQSPNDDGIPPGAIAHSEGNRRVYEVERHFYQRIKEASNIEITKKDVIKNAEGGSE